MEEIINSVMQSPENTNPNVLRSQLQGISGGSGGVLFVDCTESGTILRATKTAGEIFEAVGNGSVVIFKVSSGQLTLYMHCFFADNMNGYHFAVAMPEENSFVISSFDADTSSDYPANAKK